MFETDTRELIHVTKPQDPRFSTDRLDLVPSVGLRRVKDLTLIHISDLHISIRYYRSHIKSLRILLQEIGRVSFDHLLITGDISSTGDEDDLYVARELFEKAGLFSAERMTVLPGNHDIFGGPHRAVDVLSFPSHIRSVDYQEHMDQFFAVFEPLFGNVRWLTYPYAFPFIKEVKGVEIIGLNSIAPWTFWNNAFGTNGLIDDAQRSVLEELSEIKPEVAPPRIAAVHHHWNPLSTDASTAHELWRKIETRMMKLHDKKFLLKLLKKVGIEAVLHGHVHCNELYQRRGINFSNAGGSVCDDPVRLLKYNCLRIKEGTATLTKNVLPIPYIDELPRKKHRMRSEERITCIEKIRKVAQEKKILQGISIIKNLGNNH